MRLVIQRVKEARVDVDGQVVGRIKKGMLVLLGVARTDTTADVDFLVNKITGLRIFEDVDGKMNLSIQEAGGEFLVVSQFTLLGDCAKGRRPSFGEAADPSLGEELYNLFVERLRCEKYKVETGCFRAVMDVALVNDGPVTFVLEGKK